ncbi:MAG: hypothetical protein CMP77_15320 [Flavobacterium sp.]|nr:hypothetical protein [Flavobacterium sp.]|tara:strand:+ start:18496 stop:18921 length:426 start_codon:yes stop_codon:yes gene_type:complete
MKKLLMVSALALAGLTFTACGDDDGGGSSASLEGKWYFSKTGTAVGGQEAFIDYDHEEGCEKDYVEFVEGGVYRDVSHWSDCETDVETDSWSRSGNTITIGEGTDAVSGTIKKLTGSELRVSTTEELGGQTFNSITVFTRE